jgi:hypothetical protein
VNVVGGVHREAIQNRVAVRARAALDDVEIAAREDALARGLPRAARNGVQARIELRRIL